MQSRTAVVTGASSGIGAAAAVGLAEHGFTVVPIGRDARRLDAVGRRICEANPASVAEPLRSDFSSQAQVRELAGRLLERHPHIHLLVNNAGLVASRRRLTEDGVETTIAVNHLAPFLLTNLLQDRLRDSAPARVITTSSDAHRSGHLDLDDFNAERRWSTWSAYANSKLANVQFTRVLARRLDGTGVSANCLHPGVIRTRLGRGALLPIRVGWSLAALFFGRPKTGADTILHLATSEQGGQTSGGYFVNSRPATPSVEAQDDEHAELCGR